MTNKPHRPRYTQRLISIDDLNPESPAARRALDFRATLLAERGGADRLSALRKSSIDIVSCITAMVEDLLTRAMNGEEVDLSALNSLLNSRRREADAIGMDPEPINITPDITKYLEQKKNET
jgi:hypothetical protein